VYQIGIVDCQKQWCMKEHVARNTLNEWSSTLMDLVYKRVAKLKKLTRFRYACKIPILNKLCVKEYLDQLHERFVLVPTDKASNNIAIVCKYFYIKTLLEEIGILDTKRVSAYSLSSDNSQSIIATHLHKMEQIPLDNKQQQLPILLWIPKMHKNPSKQRFIAASHSCTTKPVSALATKCLKLVQNAHRLYCNRIKSYTGFNFMWIIDNSLEVHKLMHFTSSKKSPPRNIITYDFSTLYTSIPHDKLKEEIKSLIQKAFSGMNKKYIKVTSSKAYWSNKRNHKNVFLDCNKLVLLVEWLIDNTYIVVGDRVLRQTIGIPMGTDCLPSSKSFFVFI